MENPGTEAESTSDAASEAEANQLQAFGGHPWIPYLLPMLVFTLAGWFEPPPPTPPSDNTQNSAELAPIQDTASDDGFIPHRWYPLVYALRIGLTLVAIGVALPLYRSFPFRISALSIGCGVLGVVVWIGLCSLELEKQLAPESVASWLGISGSRVAFNPFQQLGQSPLALVSFLGVRFLGLALIVPLIEEFFLRGFVARFVEDGTWWKLPIGSSAAIAWISVAVYAAASHPGEMVAAVVWFSLVTWLVVRTKNIWDAVAAHAVTNLLLGIYVISTGHWELW